jgi:malate synthase
MLMAGMKGGQLTNASPIGGMAAVMIYQKGDPYGRSRYNPLALRAMVVDKLRERLLGLVFVPESAAAPATLDDILSGRARGTLHDCYRQSWVASPEVEYVAAGNGPLQAGLGELQALIDRPLQTVEANGKAVPTTSSGLSPAERELLQSRGVLDARGRITPLQVTRESLDGPEKLLTRSLWDAIYQPPTGDVTIEHVQHSFYMAANYGFQILNGNFAAAIDDYELKLRFMNDLATYRIYVSWLWSLAHHQSPITRDGRLLRQALTEDGVVLGKPAEPVKAGTRFDRALFEKVFAYHDEWTAAFFAEQDKSGAPGRFDRAKAPVIMALLKRQLLSPRYVQHSARVLFIVGQARPALHGQLLEAIFDLPREEIIRRVAAGTMDREALAAHDYALDVTAD